MKYTLTTYRDGKKRFTSAEDAYTQALLCGGYHLAGGTADEYEITNERGDVVAYAYTEDSPKAIEKANDYAADMREARADIARDIQRDELASRAHCGAGKS